MNCLFCDSLRRGYHASGTGNKVTMVVTVVPCSGVLVKKGLEASVTYSVYNEYCSVGQAGTVHSPRATQGGGGFRWLLGISVAYIFLLNKSPANFS
jgi:hypothetical protein